MKADFVMPNGNEGDFLKMAKILGYECVVFLYPKGRKPDAVAINESREKNGIISGAAFFSDGKKQGDEMFIRPENTMETIQKYRNRVVFSIENNFKHDYIHQRASGLNHVLASLAKERDITIGFSFSEIIAAGKRRNILLGRIIQNLRLCGKYHVNCMIASFATLPGHMRHQKDIFAFYCSMGFDKKKIKEYIGNTADLAEKLTATAKNINTKPK